MIKMSVLAMLLLLLGGCRSASEQGSISVGAWQELGRGLKLNQAERVVSVQAWVCLDQGWLEQVMCSPGTREHECLLVSTVQASHIHAALLLIALEPGQPGRWVQEGDLIVLDEPQGAAVDISIQYIDPRTQHVIEVPVAEWIADVSTNEQFPDSTFVFGGSSMIEGEVAVQSGSNYMADHTGSLVGLVTFGDELLGARQVIPDSESIQAQEWVVRKGHVPPLGTMVEVLLKPAE
jgi:hypothetical protein